MNKLNSFIFQLLTKTAKSVGCSAWYKAVGGYNSSESNNILFKKCIFLY